MTRERDARGGDVESIAAERRVEPGATSRSERLAVQRRTPPAAGAPILVQQRADASHEDPFAVHLIGVEGVHDAAERGLAEPSTPLPHLDRIQPSFGRHDVSGVEAHVGGAAAEASAAMGATAYATGNHVAFGGAPDLHTAAHEAAHTVQQRGGVQLRGGVGEADDAYERHADAVADRVVRGESAEDLLDGAGGGGGAGAGAVQHKKPDPDDKTGDTADDGPEMVEQDGTPWPVFARSGKPYLLEDQSGRPGFWASRKWITLADDYDAATFIAPSRAREILKAMGWVADDKIEFATKHLTFEFKGELNHFSVGAEAAFSMGLPKGKSALVDRDRLPDNVAGLIVTLDLDDVDLPPGSAHPPTTSEVMRAFRAASSYTGLDIDPEGQARLTAHWTPPVAVVGNGVLTMQLTQFVCRLLFGMEAYDNWFGGPPDAEPPEEPEVPKLQLENFYKSKIPGTLTHFGDIVEAGEGLRLSVQVDWPHHYPDPDVYEAPPWVTPSKFGVVSLLNCNWTFQRIDGGPATDPSAPPQVETKTTDVAEAIHRFRLGKDEPTGTFRVTCDARFDEYFEPTTFERDVVVMAPGAAMDQLKTKAYDGFGADDIDRSKGKWTGDAAPEFKASPVGGGGGASDHMAANRAAQLERLRNVAEYLRDNPNSKEAVEALDREIARQEASEKKLAADRAGRQVFQIRGTYLSRTEGLPSGPLDLHGTIETETRYETIHGDGPSTNMTFEYDVTVVRIRDMSRRFEQTDFEFTGTGDNFEEALGNAFDDLAPAYPKGLVSIEAELMTDNLPGSGKVIGFQRSTDTTWKKINEVVWDPIASIVVNLGAIALMTLVPGSAIVVAPALVAYNSIPAIDHIANEASRGTLTLGTVAMSTGEIALNLLPLVSRAKPFTKGWFIVETANWGGQVALMGASAVDAAQKLQAVQVAALAQQYEAFLELQKNSLPSDPGLAIAEDRIRRQAAELDGEISRQFWAQVEGNFIQMVAGSVIHNTSSHARQAIIDHLTARPAATASGGADAPPVPPAGGGDPTPTPTPDTPAPRPDAPAPRPDEREPKSDKDAPTAPADPAAQPPPTSAIAAEAAAEKRMRPDGNDFRTDAGDLHNVQRAWAAKHAGDTVSPIHYDPDNSTASFVIRRGDEQVRVTADVPSRITTAAELTSTTNRVIGNPISAGDGTRILRDLNEGRLDALSDVGVDVPEGTVLGEGIEFGLGEISGGKVVVVLGEKHAVDWSDLPGVKPKAHTHPSVPGNDLAKHAGDAEIPLDKILAPTEAPYIPRELVLPSPPDVAVMARLGVDGHRVITPFVLHDGKVSKPKPGDDSPRLEWVIEQPREVGKTADGSTVYETTLVAEVGGTPVASKKIWSTEPPKPTPDDLGHHYMTQPEMTPTVTPAPGGGHRKTPSGGPTTVKPVDRLTTGPDAWSNVELTDLALKHGNDTVEWAGTTLDGGPARRLLDTLDKAQVDGMRDVSAAEAVKNLDVFGKATIDKAVPPVTGEQLRVEREQLGSQVAAGAATEALKGKGTPAKLGTHADNLIAATTTAPSALAKESLIVDNNVLAGIKELMDGMAWKDLQPHKQNGINWLRAQADPPLTELKGDPKGRTVADIIGYGHDLRAANVTLGEHTSKTGLPVGGVEISISRDSPQYTSVLAELAKPPEPIGKTKGEIDRAMVADAMFANAAGDRRLMTGDYAIIDRLYLRYGPGLTTPLPKPKKQGVKRAEQIGELYPDGYEAYIPDGTGGVRMIIVVPMVEAP